MTRRVGWKILPCETCQADDPQGHQYFWSDANKVACPFRCLGESYIG